MARDEPSSDQWQVCERQCRYFEAAWQGDAVPVLEDFLPAGDNAFRDLVLPELVHIDLEFRLRRRMHARVEEYLQRYPDLRDSQQHVLELIEEEYALRLETEHGLSPTEYAERFPPLADELERRLSKVRSAKTSLRGDFRLRPADAPPPVVPGCEILEMLGRGGMGVVYKAHHVALARTVAVKLLRAGAGADAEERQRFQTEALFVASLQHPNIVEIYEVGVIDGQLFCLLEYVAGGSLQSKLGDGPMPARAAAELLEPLARAIHCAHQRGIIHRDLKPGNILLHVDGGAVVPKVTDFGLAKQMDRDQSLTKTGIVVGTAQYMAPEQANGETVTLATDVYALGAILYEMLTGRPPLQGTSVFETFQMLQSVDPVPPSRLQPTVPRDLETICLKCLHKGPSQRYASAAVLADDLKRFLAGEPIMARPVGAFERGLRWCRRKPAQALVLALLSLVIVGATAAGFLYQQQQAKDHADEIARQAEVSQKRELAAQQVTDALSQARQLRDNLGADLARPGGVFVLINKPVQWDGQIHAVRAALERARAVAAGADGLLDADVAGQIQALTDRLHEDEVHRDVALALEKIRLDRSAWSEEGFDLATAEREYPHAFARTGFTFNNDDGKVTSEHVHRIVASPIREQLLASLDDWAYVAWSRRNHGLAANLLQTARMVDPQPWRDQVRNLSAWNSFSRLEKLANQALDKEELLASTSPQMLHLLGRLLTRMDVLASPKEKKSLDNPIYKKAEVWLRRAQQQHMGDFWLNFQLGLVLKPTQPTEAAGFYRTALVIRPHSGAAWNNYGVIMRNQKDRAEALRAFRKAVECEPRNVIALANLVPCLHEKSEDAEAIAICKKIIAISPRSLAALNNLGLSYHTLRDYKAAKEAFNQAIAIDPNYVRAWNNLGRALRAEENYGEALKAYQKATEVDPQSPIAWTGLATVYFDQQKWSPASQAAKKATECDPDYANAWRSLGNALRELRDLPGAVEAGEKSVAIDPNNADAWTALGVSLRRSKKLPEAIDAHKKAVAIDPAHAPAWGNLGVALRDAKDLRGAAAAYRKSLDLNVKDAGIVGALASILDDLNEPGAEEAYERAVGLKPRDNVLWNNYGVVLRKQRKLVPAAEAFKKSIALNSKIVNPHYELVTVYRDLGRFEDGLKACERGVAAVALFEAVQLTALRIELTGLIAQDQRLAKVLAGGKAAPLEQTALADHCHRYKRRYCDAVRLYDAAFKEQPRLAESMPQKRRYHAALAALLAADGKDAESAAVDVAEQTRLRGQALAWARADLAQCAMLLDGADKDMAVAARALLNHWAAAPDLAMVRDPKRLDTLAVAERDAWRQFWVNVEMTRKVAKSE